MDIPLVAMHTTLFGTLSMRQIYTRCETRLITLYFTVEALPHFAVGIAVRNER